MLRFEEPDLEPPDHQRGLWPSDQDGFQFRRLARGVIDVAIAVRNEAESQRGGFTDIVRYPAEFDPAARNSVPGYRGGG